MRLMQWTSARRGGFAAAAALALSSLPATSQDWKLGESDSMVVEMRTQGCQRSMYIEIRARQDSFYENPEGEVAAIVRNVTPTIVSRCPGTDRIYVYGQVGSQVIFRGFVALNQGSRLVREYHARPKGIIDPKWGAPGPEHSPTPVNAAGAKDFLYLDATMSANKQASIGVEPIEELNQWLLERNYKCLTSSSASIAQDKYSLEIPQQGTKLYIIQCVSNCQGLRYSVGAYDLKSIVHHGKSRPYPTIQLDSGFFISTKAIVRFWRQKATDMTTVKIYQWSNQPGDYGSGCKLF